MGHKIIRKRLKLDSRQKMRTTQRIRLVVASVTLMFFVFIATFIYFNFGTSKKSIATAINYVWTGNINSDWYNSSNWLPVGIPASSDNVTIGLAPVNAPVLTANSAVANLTVNSGGILNLNGFSLLSSGISTLNTGGTIDIKGDSLILSGTTLLKGGVITNSDTGGVIVVLGTSTAFGSSGSLTIASDVVITSQTITIANTTFNGRVNLTKTGTSNDQSSGNNTFNGTTCIANSGTGYFLMANTTRDVFNAEVTFTSTGPGNIYPSYNGINTQFNQNIFVNCTSTGGVRIGASTGTSILATGKTVNAGSSGVSGGLVMLAGFTTATSQSFAFTGNGVLQFGPNSTFNGDVTATCGGISLCGATFNGIAALTKTGTSNDAGTGNNTFNGPTAITNSGSGYLLTANTTRDIFNTDVTFSSTGAGIIYAAYKGINTQFNQNIIINSTSTGGVRIGASTGTAILATGKTVNTGSSGVSGGLVMLAGFTTATSQSFAYTGNGVLQLGPNSTFNGDVTATCGGISLCGATFNGIAELTKTGTSNDAGTGNNTFNGPAAITNSGSGYLLTANTMRDIFNTDVTFTSTGAGIIYAAYKGINTQFNQNIIINSTSTGGVRIGASTGTSILATGKTVNAGSSGVSGGLVMLAGFTTATSQSFAFTGNAVLQLGPNSTFNGDVTATCGGISLCGATFNGIASLTKTGTTNDAGTGNNTFNGPTAITNSGSGYLLTANTTRDIFNTDVTFTSTGAGIIYAAYKGINTQFNQNIIINSTSTGGVRIGASTGTSILATGKTVNTGSSGVSGGLIMLAGFTTATSQSFAYTGNGVLQLGPNSTFDGDVTATCGGISLCGATFNGITALTKTGTTNDAGTGNNTFNGAVTITQSGTGYLLTSNSTGDIFNSEVTFTNTGSGILYIAYNGVNTQFNENIIVNNTNIGTIRFGQSNGTSTLASGKTISIGLSGFSNGGLYLKNFTQNGSTPQTLSALSGTGSVYFQSGTTFNGDLNVIFPQVYLNGSTFNGTAMIEKNGATNNSCTGANTFFGVTTIKCSGNGNLYMANSTGDVFATTVTFIQTGTGVLWPAYNGINNFAGDISTSGSLTAITFGGSTGMVTMNGNQPVNIYGSAAQPPVIKRLTMSNGNNGLTLNVPVSIATSLTFISGVIKSSSTNLLTMNNSTTVSGMTDAGYVDGPVRKIGNQAFTYPIGKGGYYRPLSISAPSLVTDHFTSEYFKTGPDTAYPVLNREAGLHHISTSEYWVLNRTNGAANVNVTLTWTSETSGGVSNLTELRVARWDIGLSKWKDAGNGATTGDINEGTIITSPAPTAFGVFTLGSSTSTNALPVELASFTVKMENSRGIIAWETKSEINNDYFTIERSENGQSFDAITKVQGAGNSTSPLKYSFEDENPLSGTSYYRLKQTDFDGKFRYYGPLPLNNKDSKEFRIAAIGPNPFSDQINISYISPDDAEVDIIVMTMSGSIAFQDHFIASGGAGTYSTNQPANLKSGVYILKAISGGKILETRKMMKK